MGMCEHPEKSGETAVENSNTARIMVFSANVVTYARTALVLLIGWFLARGMGVSAAFLIIFHDFLDHVDGVVAKVQRADGRASLDCGRWGGFVDAQCDKVVFCTTLWTLLVLHFFGGEPITAAGDEDLAGTSAFRNLFLVFSCGMLIALELMIACVRTRDYFQPQQSHTGAGGGAVRAISEGKLKQKLESVGLALLALPSPYPAYGSAFWPGIACLWGAGYFAQQSLAHKLRHAKTN